MRLLSMFWKDAVFMLLAYCAFRMAKITEADGWAVFKVAVAVLALIMAFLCVLTVVDIIEQAAKVTWDHIRKK